MKMTITVHYELTEQEIKEAIASFVKQSNNLADSVALSVNIPSQFELSAIVTLVQ